MSAMKTILAFCFVARTKKEYVLPFLLKLDWSAEICE